MPPSTITVRELERFPNDGSDDRLVFKPGVKDNNSLKQKLLDMVRLKDLVAEYIWYLLTGFLVTSVGYNYVVNTGCAQSVQEMQKRHDQYEKDEEAKLEADKSAGPKRVYSTTE